MNWNRIFVKEAAEELAVTDGLIVATKKNVSLVRRSHLLKSINDWIAKGRRGYHRAEGSGVWSCNFLQDIELSDRFKRFCRNSEALRGEPNWINANEITGNSGDVGFSLKFSTWSLTRLLKNALSPALSLSPSLSFCFVWPGLIL